MKRNILLYFCLMIIFSFSSSTFAERLAPKPVEPVISDGIEYRAPQFYMGCVEAWDSQNNQMLWRKKIYYIKYDERLEADVQDVFIEKLEIIGSRLIITNEKGHQYELNINTRQIRPISSLYAPVYVEPTEEIAKGNTEFALQLYAKLANEKKNENLFFSPYSISTALAMTYGGARGNTEKQMAEVLHFNLPQGQLHPAFANLEKQLTEGAKKGGYELNIANALWGQNGFKFMDSFIELVNKNYSADLNEVDFAKDSEGTRQTINKWVEDKTKQKIKEIIKPNTFDELTRLVLTNAIYFKGEWEYKFNKKATRDGIFSISSKDKIKVPMMYTKKVFNYGGDDTLQILVMPYKGKNLSMIVVLPRQIDGIDKLETSLTAENINNWLACSMYEINVYLPRFKTTSEFSLGQVLAKMGMSDAFSGKADFSGMEQKKELFISDVIHKAFVEVNEEGTEAAAATAVELCGSAEPPQPLEFKADHPFLFLIRDNTTGSILFMGKVVNPLQDLQG